MYLMSRCPGEGCGLFGWILQYTTCENICLHLAVYMSNAVNVPTEKAYLWLAAGEHAMPVAVYAISYSIGMGYKPYLACQHDS